MRSKLRRSALKCPTRKKPKVSAAESSGVENVEKNSAIAVTSISSTKISAIAFSSRGSIAGASQAVARRGVCGPGQEGEHGVERHRHDRDVDGQRQHETGVLAER